MLWSYKCICLTTSISYIHSLKCVYLSESPTYFPQIRKYADLLNPECSVKTKYRVLTKLGFSFTQAASVLCERPGLLTQHLQQEFVPRLKYAYYVYSEVNGSVDPLPCGGHSFDNCVSVCEDTLPYSTYVTVMWFIVCLPFTNHTYRLLMGVAGVDPTYLAETTR